MLDANGIPIAARHYIYGRVQAGGNLSMAIAATSAPDVRADTSIRESGLIGRVLYFSQFLYRFAFAFMLFLYMRHQGLASGLLNEQGIRVLLALYISTVALIMVLARGRRLSVPLQRALVLNDIVGLMIGTPHDPNHGLPTLFVYYLAFADLGLRYRYRLYVEALVMGLVAIGVMVYLRTTFIHIGFNVLDAWQTLLLVIVILHGLQVFARRDRARRLIQQAQERLQLALESPGVGAWSSDDPLRQLKVDGQIREVLGLTPDRVTDRMSDFMGSIHPDDRPRVLESYTRFVRTGGTDYEDEYRVFRPNGDVRTISSRARARRTPDGFAESVSGMVWDLTEQKRQQEALVRMEERYRLATQSARVGVWIWHVDEDRFEHDEAINRLLELPADARATRLDNILALVHPEDRERFHDKLKEHLRSKATDFFDEIRVQLPNGRERVIHSRATIYRDEWGQPLRIAGANWDATTLALARKELEQRTLDLERSNRELDDFSYIASHDLKEPLRGIRNYAQYVQQDYDAVLDDEGRAMVQKIRDQAQRMETLVDELLHIARLGRTQMELREVDLSDLAAQVLASLEFSIREKAVDVRVPRPLPRVRCDRVRVGELLRNLITNAIKYNDRPVRWVEIGYDDAGSELVLHVRDNGIGIQAEHHERAFKLFQRLHARDAYDGGTGVGLTIVQRVAQQHGGRAWIESDGQSGTTIHFTLQPPALP
jgi:PAS domain S-box-containing protein